MSAKILIVDDARLNREVLKLALTPGGYEFFEADNGESAIEVIQSRQIDLVLLDLMMPVMDGFEFLKWRKDHPVYSAIPVIVNSALDDFESIRNALDMGSYDYFTKPLLEQDLKVILPLKIKNAIQARMLYQELMVKTERLENEMELAGKYQRSLLPSQPTLTGLKVATVYEPYIGVAGDFFDVIEVGTGAAAVIADVSGHGLLSAMVSSNLKLLFNRYMTQTGSPRETFRNLNRDLMRLTRAEDYVTSFCVYYDPQAGELTFASAGHPDQLYYDRVSGKTERLRSEGFFLGMFEDSEQFVKQEQETRQTAPGDRLLIFTDGAVEAMDENRDQFGMDRWEEVFASTVDLPLEEASDLLLNRLQEYTSGRLQDDVAFLVMEFGG